MPDRSVLVLALTLAVPIWLAQCAPTDQTDPPDSSSADGDADSDSDADSDLSCATDNECDDRIVCTLDHCDEGHCTHQPCLDCCGEGLECIVDFGCGHPPTPCTEDDECQDDTPCTLDRCHDETFCQHLPQNGLCEDGEICLAALGCIPSPPEDCEEDIDCQPDRPCLGNWYCDPEFGCQFLSVLDCDDGNPCTDDICDDGEDGCIHPPRDADGDDHGDEECGGDDCDDSDPDRHPGADEACDGEDDDCDGDVDEGCCEEGEPCETECGTTGTRECLPDGSEGECTPPAEVCNGDDDDCDGAVDEECCDEGEPCETECGTTGTRDCPADGSEGDCLPPEEECNGTDDDCDDLIDEGCCVEGEPCTTTCGSTGTRECRPDGTEGPCRPPGESCNGSDDDCNGTIDDDFECSPPGREQPCVTSCRSTGTRDCSDTCEWGACRPPVETCNGEDDDCDGEEDNGFACVLGDEEPCPTSCGSTGTRACLRDCSWDVCIPPDEVCNGVDDDCDRACDDGFHCCRGTERSCSALGFHAGTAICADDCGRWVTAGCTNCGNGRVDAGEQCDGADLDGNDCTTVPGDFGGGRLRCADGCRFDTSECDGCGNGRVDAGEDCDDDDLDGETCESIGAGSGDLACTDDCEFDDSDCEDFNPTGFYTLDPIPAYRCLNFIVWWVDYSVPNLTFTDSGAVLEVSGAPCEAGDSMEGPSAAETREINVRCVYSGGCTETYSLTGTFVTDNRWEGVFRATYRGADCTAHEPHCRDQSWEVVGTR